MLRCVCSAREVRVGTPLVLPTQYPNRAMLPSPLSLPPPRSPGLAQDHHQADARGAAGGGAAGVLVVSGGVGEPGDPRRDAGDGVHGAGAVHTEKGGGH